VEGIYVYPYFNILWIYCIWKRVYYDIFVSFWFHWIDMKFVIIFILMTLSGFHEILTSGFSAISCAPISLINILKHLRIWFWIRGDYGLETLILRYATYCLVRTGSQQVFTIITEKSLNSLKLFIVEYISGISSFKWGECSKNTISPR
jgi:hypothetical protein